MSRMFNSLPGPRTSFVLFSLAVFPWMAGCGSDDTPPATGNGGGKKAVSASGQSDPTTPQSDDEKSGTAKKSSGSATLAKVKFKDAAGKTAYSVKFRADGAKLVDGQEQEVARYNYSEGKVKIKDEKDEVLGYIVGDATRLKIEDPTQETAWFKLQPQDDGDWKVEDGKDQLVYRIKRRDYGFEIETPDDKRLAKVKFSDGKTSLRDAAEKTLFSTKDKITPLAVAPLGCEKIQDVRIRFGILVALERVTSN